MKIYNERPYQRLIYRHLLENPRAAVNAQMGLGKTVATLTPLLSLDRYGDEVFPVFVLAPQRVARSVWPSEVTTWAHLNGLRVSTILGTADERLAALKTHADIYCMNYENLPWLWDVFGDAGRAWPFRTVVADESRRLANFRLRGGGERAKVLGRVAHKYVRRWINLSGSPTPNGLLDLWGQMWFIDGGARLGRTYDDFKMRWFHPSFSGYGFDPMPHAEAEITSRISDVCLSLRSRDWLPVDQVRQIVVPITLPPAARRVYDEVERRMYTELLSEPLEVFNAAAKLTKCLQIAAGAAYMDKKATRWEKIHDAKIEALRSVVDQAESPVIVAYHWRSDAERILDAFKPPFAQVLDQKQSTIDRWNAGKIPMLLAHPASAAHGLNLQDGGNTTVFFSSYWDLELDEQIIERVGPVRQYQAGHPRPVFAYRLVATDTIDEDVLSTLERKARLQDSVMQRLKSKWG